jgi:hypothetical protein
LKHPDEKSRYQVYVLHSWREPADPVEHTPTWRFILEEPKTGQRRGFKDLAALMDFLVMEQERADITDKQ